MHTARIPLWHIEAEFAAWPIASCVAFENPFEVLDPDLPKDSPTHKLWRSAERSIVERAAGVSLDLGVEIRDRIWFSTSGDDSRASRRPLTALRSKRPLVRFLRDLSAWHLDPNGAMVEPRPDNDLSQKWGGEDGPTGRERWRWLTFALPEDLIAAARNRLGPPPAAVGTVQPVLERVLDDSGLAELHMHLGAGLSFGLLWVGLMIRLARPDVRQDAFVSPGAVFGAGADFGSWLIRAALVRLILAWYLADVRRSTFDRYLTGNVRERVEALLSEQDWERLIVALRGDLWEGRLGNGEYVELQRIYRQLADLQPPPMMRDVEEAHRADPIALFFPPGFEGRPSAEMNFISAALGHMEEQRDDRWFERLFWQYVRLRCLYYRHVTQRPMVPGLQWFVRHYDRIKVAGDAIPFDVLVQKAARCSGYGKGLRSLEVRMSPSNDQSELRNKVFKPVEGIERLANSTTSSEGANAVCRKAKDALRCAREAFPAYFKDGMEFGIVFHFPKDRGGGARKGRPKAHWMQTHAHPDSIADPPNFGYRYAAFYKGWLYQQFALQRFIMDQPYVLWCVRGFDVCTDELGVPTWVVAPVINAVRETSRDSCRAWHHVRREMIPPPRVTAHVGEDFVHLLSGLRRVDEAMTHLAREEGDRLGHAVALGQDPAAWSTRNRRVTMAREERLFDLLWELDEYEERGLRARPGDRPNTVRREIARLSKQIFGDFFDATKLSMTIRYLHDPLVLQYELGFPFGLFTAVGAEDSLRLAYRYLTDGAVFQRGRQTDWIEIDGEETEAMGNLQDALIHRAAHRGISVEVNPSSNLLIGDLGNLDTHPVWRLAAPHGDGRTSRVRVVIGSDDPLTFASKLPEEYQLIWDTMVDAGHSDDDAQAWIERARADGLAVRFTLKNGVEKLLHHRRRDPNR